MAPHEAIIDSSLQATDLDWCLAENRVLASEQEADPHQRCRQALGLSVLAVFWLGALWFNKRVFLAPWPWLRRAGVESKSAALVLEQTP